MVVESEETEERKVEIRSRTDGTLQVHLFNRLDEDVPGYGLVASGWREDTAFISIVDSLEHARAIARERMMRG